MTLFGIKNWRFENLEMNLRLNDLRFTIELSIVNRSMVHISNQLPSIIRHSEFRTFSSNSGYFNIIPVVLANI
jgi:hypothetical protein